MEKNEMTASEALYGFCWWLTSRDKQTIMSAKDDAWTAAVLIEKFCEVNKLTPTRNDWEKLLIHPKD